MADVMNAITIVRHFLQVCFHGEDSSDFTAREQSDGVQF